MAPELLDVLTGQATTGDAVSEWHADINDQTVRLRASTGKVFGDPDEAWAGAKALRDSIVGLGHELYGQCETGVVSEFGGEGMPITGWRGRVELWFATQPKAGSSAG
jgi:hypothetical protein